METPLTPRSFAESLIAELVAAIDAVVGGVTASPAAEGAHGPGWCITATAKGALTGTALLWVDQSGAEALARRVMGMDETPDAATVADMLGEMWSQAAGAQATKPPFTAVEIALAGAAAGESPAPAVWADLHVGDAVARVAVGGATIVAEAAVATTAMVATARVAGAADHGAANKLDAVLDIELPLVVRFARTVMPLKTLLTLGPGSIIDMERSPDEPVQMLVGDRLIARGEVVVVGGNYGVRITDVVSPTERIRALEA
ncbi:MAG: FliM/FliN family flagellar motor switch protein [Vicinamibacterales bacterium]|jgi:flagellar motor switch protein FliN/FliY